jgi:hypothetical protein
MNALTAASSEDPRIVHVASNYAGELDLSDLQFSKRPFNGGSAYAQSKQINRMLSTVRECWVFILFANPQHSTWLAASRRTASLY